MSIERLMLETTEEDILRGMSPHNSIYDNVMIAVEKELFETYLAANRYNVALTARVLGISRGNLQAKLKLYFGDKYVGTRSK